jgi:hypothetical protein
LGNPRIGDVILRGLAGDSAASSYVIHEPVSDRLLSGPHPSLSEAIAAADSLLEADGRIWQEQVDERGRSLGPPSLLPRLASSTD